MRGLAEFVMSGRRQATLTVMLIGAIPLIYFLSPVLVALVLMRKGVQEGLWLAGWAALPLVAWVIYPLLAFGVLGSLLPLLVLGALVGLAAVLRSTRSWQLTVVSGIGVGLVIELYLRVQPQIIDLLLVQLAPLLESGAAQPVDRGDLIALVTTVHLIMVLLLLMVARWLQAMLYNPGGFRQEMHALRIEPKVATPLVVLMLLSGLNLGLPSMWLMYFALPLIVAGTALVHAVIAGRRLAALWLLAFYTVYPMILQFIVLVALIDSFYDFRKTKPTAP